MDLNYTKQRIYRSLSKRDAAPAKRSGTLPDLTMKTRLFRIFFTKPGESS